MLLTIAIVSTIILVIGLWIFNRVAWGGGIRPPSYELLQPASPPADPPAALPEAAQEQLELRCTSCSLIKPLPEMFRLSAALGMLMATALKNTTAQQACPECGGPLEIVTRRTITHTSQSGSLTFTTLHNGAATQISVNGRTYSSVAEIEDSQMRRVIAEALNISEDSDDYSWKQ